MNNEKIVKVLVTSMVEFKTDLSVDEAINQFEQNCIQSFSDTQDLTILRTEWRETERVSYVLHNKTNTQILLKPLK